MWVNRELSDASVEVQMLVTIENEWFVDEKGRRVLLRGVNLGGSSKVPSKPNGATHIHTDFTSRDVSFVGRPFPLRTRTTILEGSNTGASTPCDS